MYCVHNVPAAILFAFNSGNRWHLNSSLTAVRSCLDGAFCRDARNSDCLDRSVLVAAPRWRAFAVRRCQTRRHLLFMYVVLDSGSQQFKCLNHVPVCFKTLRHECADGAACGDRQCQGSRFYQWMRCTRDCFLRICRFGNVPLHPLSFAVLLQPVPDALEGGFQMTARISADMVHQAAAAILRASVYKLVANR